MKAKYLFPNKYKKIGWFVLIPSSIIGVIILVIDLEPTFLDLNAPAIFVDNFLKGKKIFGIVENNILNEILGILVIISSLLVSFSKEKNEDEFIQEIRLESLVWAVYVNYGVLIIAFVFIYDISFLWVMIFNMFTILIFFIIRFQWQISKLNKSATYEK